MILDSLEDLSNGKEIPEFFFTASIRDSNSMEYVQISSEESYIELDFGGSIYSEGVGNDGIPGWMHTFWINGDEDGRSDLSDFDLVEYLLGNATHFTIDYPEEYQYDSENNGFEEFDE